MWAMEICPWTWGWRQKKDVRMIYPSCGRCEASSSFSSLLLHLNSFTFSHFCRVTVGDFIAFMKVASVGISKSSKMGHHAQTKRRIRSLWSFWNLLCQITPTRETARRDIPISHFTPGKVRSVGWQIWAERHFTHQIPPVIVKLKEFPASKKMISWFPQWNRGSLTPAGSHSWQHGCFNSSFLSSLVSSSHRRRRLHICSKSFQMFWFGVAVAHAWLHLSH